jgi:hypothetical protein
MGIELEIESKRVRQSLYHINWLINQIENNYTLLIEISPDAGENVKNKVRLLSQSMIMIQVV